MPSAEELRVFLAREDWPFRLRESTELEHLHRVTTRARQWPEVLALAFDHRKQLESLGPAPKISRFKQLVAQGLQRAAGSGAGALVDGKYGEEALFSLTGTGLWLARPVELPGSQPLEFEAGDNVGVALRAWPAEHVVKCLCFYGARDLPRLRLLYQACLDTCRELLLEIIAERLPEALAEIYAAGIRPDWWKLPPPASGQAWEALEQVIGRNDPHCRGVLLLGMEASEEQLERDLALAARHPLCKGFAVGRSIFMQSARRWFEGDCGDETVVNEVAANYARLVQSWRTARSACKESVS
jgi:5-dehydro-2-deoxygluconokinase